MVEKKKTTKKKEKGDKGKTDAQKKRFKIAETFAKNLITKFKRTVKAVVVYGSTARGTAKVKSDIDIFVIMDDTKIEREIPQEIKDRIWNEILRIAKETSKDITIQAFMFLTEFWESLRTAEPVTLAILRDGVPVFDVGVFMPAKRMLQRGNIPTTREAVEKKIHAAPQFVEYAQARLKSTAHYMEQAMATAGNAALMFIGRVPQNKEKVPDELNEYFVKQKLLEEKYVIEAKKIHKFAKKMETLKKEDVKDIGAKIDEYLKMTDDFVKRMQLLIKELEQRKKSNVLMKTYKTFLKANVGALKYIGVKPPASLKELPQIMYKNFPELKDIHSDLFGGLTKSLMKIKKGEIEHIPEREVYILREKTKIFVLQLGKKLKEMKDKGEIKTPIPDISPKDHDMEKLEEKSEVEKETKKD